MEEEKSYNRHKSRIEIQRTGLSSDDYQRRCCENRQAHSMIEEKIKKERKKEKRKKIKSKKRNRLEPERELSILGVYITILA